MGDFEAVDSCINGKKEFFNSISHEIWSNPELKYKEFFAHDILCTALTEQGFEVERNYLLPTAFKATFSSSQTGEISTVAVLLEYDALPDIGHACGHNLIAEAGLAAGIAIKSVMENDMNIKGKLVVMGTPAEEGGGGKIELMKRNAFKDIDAVLMVHPSKFNATYGPMLSCSRYSVDFKGKEAHASAFPWKGLNALDAVVACYNNLSLLRQQIKGTCRVSAIITKGGTVLNVIPAAASMQLMLRAATKGELSSLQTRVQKCIEAAATATGCSFEIQKLGLDYENLLYNSTIGDIYDKYAKKLGLDGSSSTDIPAGSSDIGNISHVLPSIHPFFGIGTTEVNHSIGFTEAADSSSAQVPTLNAARAMAMTALHLMRCPDALRRAKEQLMVDIQRDSEE